MASAAPASRSFALSVVRSTQRGEGRGQGEKSDSHGDNNSNELPFLEHSQLAGTRPSQSITDRISFNSVLICPVYWLRKLRGRISYLRSQGSQLVGQGFEPRAPVGQAVNTRICRPWGEKCLQVTHRVDKVACTRCHYSRLCPWFVWPLGKSQIFWLLSS